MELLGLSHYWAFAVLLMIGFYAVIAKTNLIKRATQRKLLMKI